ncbi:MAG TPA: GNAT family N-acetyltransferase [Pyrinomonadaceae bacterium]|jgi:CelD/BcsL family acetyltransferase involved in cellulose biosynthesis/GNAT superfamily N-acetyltransferase
MSISTETQELREFAARAASPAVGGDLGKLRYEAQQLTELSQIEAARGGGALAAWENLLSADPTGTLFQGPIWCLEWYRAYNERYQPRMLVVTCGGALAGLVPLAVERATGELVFASGIMSDYRDVLALPQHKQMVVEHLLRFYRAGNFPTPLRLGPMLPESNTVALARAACKRVPGANVIPRTHPGWRWWPTDNSAAEFVKKKSVRQAIKHYQRQGEVRLERVESAAAWHEFKHEFFDQHSLRQMYAGRPVSFTDGMKQAFYESLIINNPADVHAVTLSVGGRIVAAHYGPVRDGVLYWGAPAFDIRETQRSPGLVLLAMIIQDAQRLGLRGIDLTIGVEEYKKRFSNSHVELPTVEIYGRRQYYAQVLRDRSVAGSKLLVAKLRGPEAWDGIKARLDERVEQARRLPELGARESLARLTRRVANAVGERARWLTLIAAPSDLLPAEPVLGEGEVCSFNEDELRDLLRWQGASQETGREISARVRRAPDELRKGRTLHTVLVNGRLAGWGWSYWPQGPERIDVTQTELEFAPRSVSLYDFYTIPEYRGRRLYQALLTHILRTRFAEGAERAYIMVRDTNVASRKAIERVGFRPALVDEVVRVLGRTRVRRV